ncbi:putative 1-acyl-sn-glycerol-3-phosphate acyltransferase 4 [Nosema granulosis]|uniref:1-acyl-sn-glycerol-3-phosphate acyltransferase 4 n=1 Tax=Nosema granulosis TaxID=83296 RepID=A0A9P6H0L2_9MICR|nr:putative 1-acyl-sn-glycerol-3-phosphate acyltransferase 4 [Nosema granulosis]
MGISIIKIACFTAIILLLLCAIPYILLAYIVRIFNKPLSIKMTSCWAFVYWSLFGIIFRRSYVLKGSNVLKHKTNYLVVSNHIGSMDFMVLNELFREKRMLQNLKYIVKYQLRFIPIFYQMISLANFLIVKRDFQQDKKRIIEYLETMAKHKIPSCLILYPEGSRFTEEKKEKCWEFCERTGNVKLSNVLFPRFRGIELIGSKVNKDYITDIADITIIHKNKNVPPLWRVLFTEFKEEIVFDIRTIPLIDVKNYKEFLTESFIRKDNLIEQIRKK